MDFYPRPPRGGRHFAVPRRIGAFGISIHALREEGDRLRPEPAGRHPDFYPRPPRGGRLDASRVATDYIEISIHALREEGDLAATNICEEAFRFLSTPSARRATCYKCNLSANRAISIHALREEGDGAAVSKTAGCRFNPCRISIHALREEGDRNKNNRKQKRYFNFYPRPPRGGRPILSGKWNRIVAFLSTPSARRATRLF